MARFLGLPTPLRSLLAPFRQLSTGRRHFLRTQIIKAAFGAIFGGLYIATAASSYLLLPLVLGGILMPLVLGAGVTLPIRLRVAEATSTASFALFLTFMAFLTGGLESPFVSLFMLVFFEGAVSRNRIPILVALGSTASAFLALDYLSQADLVVRSADIDSPFLTNGAFLLLVFIQGAAHALEARHLRNKSADDTEIERERSRFFADHASDLITRHDPDGRIMAANAASRRLLGYAPAELIGRHILEFVHLEDRESVKAGFVQAAQRPTNDGGLMRLRRRDGTYVWAEMRSRRVLLKTGHDSEIVAVTRDVTAQKEANDALLNALARAEEASRAKSRFLANMSHELRTPLNAIIGFSEMMSTEMLGPLDARYADYARVVNESGRHLLGIINTVLDMAKIEANRLELSPEQFCLSTVTDEAMQFLALEARKKNISLHRDIALDADLLWADRSAVKQMLINLVSNGVKYSNKDASVSVRARRVPQGVEIAVSDTGIGISKNDIARLAMPFEQVETEHTKTHKGTGLGLALVKAFAQLHNGTMTIDSEIGVGTTIRLVLPSAASAGAEAPARDDRPRRTA